MRTLIKISFLFITFILIGVGIVGISYFKNKWALEEWLRKPAAPGEMVDVGDVSLYATLKGEGPYTVVVFPGFGASSIEWWNLQDTWAKEFRVLTFDRPGYTWSSAADSEYSGKEAARDTVKLLDHYGITEKVILVGHSIGCRYAEDLAKLVPSRIAGVVFVDPILDPKLLQGKIPEKWFDLFVDQRRSLDRAVFASKIGFFRFLNMTPYEVPTPIRPHVLNNLANLKTQKAMANEFDKIVMAGIFADKDNFPAVPLSVLYHSANENLALMQEFGAPADVAKTIEETWMLSSRRYVQLSPNAEWKTLTKGVAGLHLENPQAITDALHSVVERRKK